MKKLKSLKTLSSLGATIAITPIVATACNNDDDTVEKVNVKIYNWKNTGEYYSLMNQQQVVDEFISQNKAGENDIPADIYDYITVSSSGEGINRTILVEVTKSNDLYGGRTSINLEVEKVDINHFT